jgi:hypothetical protein
MTVASDLIELKKMEATTDVDASSLAALSTFGSVFAFAAAAAHAEGRDPADEVELLARHSELSAPEVRTIAASLRQLGFKAPADRLKLIAGKRRHDLRPL